MTERFEQQTCFHPGCVEIGCYGTGVSLLKGRIGKWYCLTHLPDKNRNWSKVRHDGSPIADEKRLGVRRSDPVAEISKLEARPEGVDQKIVSPPRATQSEARRKFYEKPAV